ncbi:MAG: 4Fe-4S dicluster domain-containing protein, partial [Paramuribaculum sp.]|nr:4Fe-4S dicluster domain-containing protein [Paramuribaculum sp.]
MYLLTGNKAECSGCTACQQICGHGSITMQTDEDGFIFPVKDLTTCVNCGLCEQVCPFD